MPTSKEVVVAPGQQARARARVPIHHQRRGVGGGHRRQRDQGREERQLRAVAAQSTEELRPHRIARGEKEEEQEEGLVLAGEVYVRLAHEHAHQQGGRDRTQVEPAETQPSEQGSQGERQEDRRDRLGSQEIKKHVEHPRGGATAVIALLESELDAALEELRAADEVEAVELP
jgi:hypothetical protein